MAYGVHLGILLMCLVQAEHVCCLWAAQAQRRNGNAYVGFSHQDGGFGGSYPQSELRQASGSPGSAQSGSFNSWGLPSDGYTQTVSLTDNGASVRSASKPSTWRKLNQVPKQQSFGLSTAIASGSSVSMYDKKRTPSTSTYLSGGSASLQSPLRETYSFRPPAAAHTPAGFSPSLSSSLFGAGAPPHRGPVRTRTSASAPARRVSPKPSSSLHNKRTGTHPGAGKPYTSKLFPVNAGNAQGSYKPTSTSHVTTSSSYTSVERIPTSMGSRQGSWNSRNPAQGGRDLLTSGVSGAGTSGLRFAPTRTHNIPQRYGGHAIRRLKDPDQKEVSVRKPKPAPQRPYVAPQRPYVAPQRPYVAPTQSPAPSHKPKPQRVHPETTWKKIRLRLAQ